MSLAHDAFGPGTPPRRAGGQIHPRAVRAYDIRGRAGEEIDPDGAYALGRSYAAAAQEAGLQHIAVGRDGRVSSPSLEQALVWGLCDGGMKVERVGLCPTPMLSFAVRRLGLDGAVMVTASHNPPGENGFKILLGADRVHGARLRALVGTPPGPGSLGWARKAEICEAYVESLAAAAEDMADLSVVWDCGNGATGHIVQRLAARLPGRHRLLNAQVDGRFPAHHPDPAVAANLDQLAQAVTEHRCDLGVAFDGDGDRLGVVGPDGRVLWADQLILLLARDLLTERPGAAIVGDVKCSRILFEGVERAGGRAVLAPSGYVLVREAMLREDAALAGELSGHIFYDTGWGVVDDALYAAIRTFLAVSRLPGGLPAFRESLPPSFTTPELRIPCEESRKPQVVREVAARMAGEGGAFDEDLGLRVSGPDGWWLLRASGTEPKLTCRCEAAHPDALERLKARLAAELRASGVELDV